MDDAAACDETSLTARPSRQKQSGDRFHQLKGGAMRFAQAHAITDICLLVESVERSIAFYVDKLGFKLRRRAEGFADFSGAGVTLAVWEREHMGRSTGVPARATTAAERKTIIAVEMARVSLIDDTYRELSAAAVVFERPPADYPWNARCAYFVDPDGTLWELYAWLDGGPEAGHTIAP